MPLTKRPSSFQMLRSEKMGKVTRQQEPKYISNLHTALHTPHSLLGPWSHHLILELRKLSFPDWYLPLYSSPTPQFFPYISSRVIISKCKLGSTTQTPAWPHPCSHHSHCLSLYILLIWFLKYAYLFHSPGLFFNWLSSFLLQLLVLKVSV